MHILMKDWLINYYKNLVNGNHYANIYYGQYIEGGNEHVNIIWQEKSSKVLRGSYIS